MSNKKFYLGIDIGSVSVKTTLIDNECNVIEDNYTRHKGQPIKTVISSLKNLLTKVSPEQIEGIGVTGTGGKLIADILGGTFVNEVIAQTKSMSKMYPNVRTIIEMGGEDSKLILLGSQEDFVDSTSTENSQSTTDNDKVCEGCCGDFGTVKSVVEKNLEDFAMNTLCAAGTGSFLDQQATRLNLSIEQFSELALKSKNPPRIAGRCSVFAKSDMIHLQQIATPDYDIVAGLCYAVARNFKSNIARGKKFVKPISFQGGVAANKGMIKAFEDVLELQRGELVIPKHFTSMGAIGSALIVAETLKTNNQVSSINRQDLAKGIERLEEYQKVHQGLSEGVAPLELSYEESEKIKHARDHHYEFPKDGSKVKGYLGVDVGYVSTNVVVTDEKGRVVARRYLPTAGRPLQAVTQGLKEIGEEVGDRVEILGVATTGSGRYLTADFIGADIVRNEITAQATASIFIDPTVDTIFEIGGQDSKYISVSDGVIVDFEMNKVCAAGTGSFLEEQAEKLNLNIKEEFSDCALSSKSPSRLGERCTVFIESDLVHHQQQGASREDLVAGLSYSIVYNYLNRVVGDKKVGNNIFFQGGTAANRGVVAAFEKVTGKKITVPPHHDVTGAIGCCLLAMNHGKEKSNFKGFDLTKRKYEVTSFECKHCSNLCEINRVSIEGEKPLYYGARCERYDFDKKKSGTEHIPDLFTEREKLLLTTYPLPGYEYKAEGIGKADLRKVVSSNQLAVSSEQSAVGNNQSSIVNRQSSIKIGLPRMLLMLDLFPLWSAFFTELGFEVVPSDSTSKKLIHDGVETVVAETCYPIKVAHGHILNLIEKGVDYIFLPSIIDMKAPKKDVERTQVCPYVQASPYIISSAIDFKSKGIKVLSPALYFQRDRKHLVNALVKMGKELGKKPSEVKKALAKAEEYQEKYKDAVRKRGEEVLANLKENETALVIVGRSYNSCDSGLNLDLPKKLKDLGVLCIPMEMLPIDSIDIWQDHPNMYWRYGQRILSAAKIIRNDKRLYAVYITNFGCGPDSFITHSFKEEMKGKPYLQLEVDEHSADAGAITRCEAFLDSLANAKVLPKEKRKPLFASILPGDKKRTVLLPYMADHAYALKSAFIACNVPAEVLPESDKETLEWGRKFTNGKECYPCAITTGDIVKWTKKEGFNPNEVAFFMGAADGPCRFGQYRVLQRLVLDELGYEDIPIVSLDSKNGYSDIGGMDKGFTRLAWKAMVAVDIIQKACWETRPYEINKGETDSVYQESLKMICDEIMRNGRGNLPLVMKKISEMFKAIKVDKSQNKPIIGMVGEIFVRANRFSNENIVREVEELGGEIWVAPLSEWFFYTNFTYKRRSLALGRYKNYIGATIKNWVQKLDEHELAKPFYGFLRSLEEPTTEENLALANPYIADTFEGEAILSIGKGIDYAKKNLSGVINTIPFTCLPGNIVSAVSKRVREDYDNIPWLNVAFDGTEQTTARTRLEAFMYQTKLYNENKKK